MHASLGLRPFPSVQLWDKYPVYFFPLLLQERKLQIMHITVTAATSTNRNLLIFYWLGHRGRNPVAIVAKLTVDGLRHGTTRVQLIETALRSGLHKLVTAGLVDGLGIRARTYWQGDSSLVTNDWLESNIRSSGSVLGATRTS
ncbi:hypothetical protein EDD18DRAFT_1110519 [Armillaria luteobubalina]|uniref:Uncharacterized protein n=1 Tax=Armillaria luteobubalina TaxID=153913 RepID=A0AA39PPS5_9AGAR|nr:hypothetical protein EDD18DRAFT_1110519 [Armillaria luteobubalina]